MTEKVQSECDREGFKKPLIKPGVIKQMMHVV